MGDDAGDVQHQGRPFTAEELEGALDMLGYDVAYDDQLAQGQAYIAQMQQRIGASSLTPQIVMDFLLRHTPASVQKSLKHPTSPPQTKQGSEALTDRLFALAVLGIAQVQAAQDILLSYLDNTTPAERWLAAIGLARMRDERVLPALEHILLEYLDPATPDDWVVISDYTFSGWRRQLPWLLANWGDVRAVPLLRATLIAKVRAEVEILVPPDGPEGTFVAAGKRWSGQEAWSWYYYAQKLWLDDEHGLVFALGRLGAFGALMGIEAPPGIYNFYGQTKYDGVWRLPNSEAEDHADLFRGYMWRVGLCCGYLDKEFRNRMEQIVWFRDEPAYAEAVASLLVAQFGLTHDEAQQAMRDYDEAAYTINTTLRYERRASAD